MSFAAFVWAWQQPVENAMDQHVLLALANISPLRETYASVTYIGESIQRSERQVRRSLANLEAGGFIVITERIGRTDLIRLNIPADFVVKMPPEGDLEKGKRGRPRKTKTPDMGQENPGHGTGKPPPSVSDEPKEEPKKEPRVEANASVAEGDASVAKQAFDAWNVWAERQAKAQAVAYTDQRRRALNARLKQVGSVAGWLELLQRIERSPFLMGSTSHRFAIDLDFVLQPSSFTKILEGKYEGRHERPDPASPSGLSRRAENAVQGLMEAPDPRRGRWSL